MPENDFSTQISKNKSLKIVSEFNTTAAVQASAYRLTKFELYDLVN